MLRRFAPLLLLLLGLTLALSLGLPQFLSLKNLGAQQDIIKAFIAENFLLSLLLYAFIYTLFVCFSLPGALILSLAGGLLFGAVLATPLIVGAATLGASIVFIFARKAQIDISKLGKTAKQFKEGFNKNAFNYLLFLRLTPIFPFFLVNLAPALLGVKFKTFVMSTLFGITPATVIYSYIGQSLGFVIENPSQIVSKEIIIALCGLGLLALLPILLKRKSKNV